MLITKQGVYVHHDVELHESYLGNSIIADKKMDIPLITLLVFVKMAMVFFSSEIKRYNM